MTVELSGVIVGSCIGLVGGLGGVFIGHILTNRRESKTRKISGLQDVLRELQKRNRLALDITQHVNSVGSSGERLFQVPGWKECTLALQERSWKVSCITFLPEAFEDFRILDSKIVQLMDDQFDQGLVVKELQDCIATIEYKITLGMAAHR